MERELTLAIVTLRTCGPLLLLWGWGAHPPRSPPSARELEKVHSRHLWSPVIPALLAFAVLVGWVTQEPDPADEAVGWGCAILALGFAGIWARTLLRAAIALFPVRASDEDARTVGVLRPRVVVGRSLRARLDERELEAVLAHERAHVRHRDPLRIWLAQLVADLQWPMPWAAERFRQWRSSLELARDEDARASGVDGLDLASAIVVAARLGSAPIPATAGLVEAHGLEERIARLLAPLPIPTHRQGTRWVPVAFAALLVIAIVIGRVWGEVLVRALAI